MIDWKRVEALQNEIGVDDFNEVVELFLEEVEEVILRLKAGPDPARLGEELHFLKGSALNLGFAELGTICAAGEKQAAQGKAAHVDIAGILKFYDTSITEFTTRLGIQKAA